MRERWATSITSTTSKMSITACHCCAYNGKGDPHCLDCVRIDQDDIRIKKSPHLGDRAGECLSKDQTERFAPQPADNLDLDEKAERVKMLLYTISSFTPLELVVALHMARGGRLIDLSAELQKMVKVCARSRTLKRGRAGRSLVGMKKIAMLKRFAPFSAVLGSVEGEGDE